MILIDLSETHPEKTSYLMELLERFQYMLKTCINISVFVNHYLYPFPFARCLNWGKPVFTIWDEGQLWKQINT